MLIMDKVNVLLFLVVFMVVESSCWATCVDKNCGSVICDKDESINGLVNLMTVTFQGIAKLIRDAQEELRRKGLKETPVTETQITTPEQCVKSKDLLEMDKLKNDCSALYKDGETKSGIFRIWPKFLRNPISVYCDMDTDGGGWTLIQRRGDFKPHINFFETWDTYKNGFGNLSTEFWIGNDKIFALTNQQKTTLRVDLEDFDGVKVHATYSKFRIGCELEKYVLTVEGYSGDAGDSLAHHNGKVFATKDNDASECSTTYKGSWWFHACHQSHLNGQYHGGYHSSYADGVNWLAFRGYNYSVKLSEMKIRPSVF